MAADHFHKQTSSFVYLFHCLHSIVWCVPSLVLIWPPLFQGIALHLTNDWSNRIWDKIINIDRMEWYTIQTQKFVNESCCGISLKRESIDVSTLDRFWEHKDELWFHYFCVDHELTETFYSICVYALEGIECNVESGS